MADFLNNFKVIHHFLKGVISNAKGEYTLTFVQEPDGRWYIDRPWDVSRGNLEMVADSDDLLSYLDTQCNHRVTLHVIPSQERKKIDDHIELRQLDKSLAGGSHYDATSIEGFHMQRIRIYPVTLCVLGHYPKYLYVKQVS